MKDDRDEGPPSGAKLNQILERAKAEWEAAFDSISEGIVVVEADGKIRRVNRALAVLLGRDVRSTAGLSCCDLFPHHKAYETACPVLNFPEGKKGAFEVFFPDYRYYEDSVHPIMRGARTQGFVITVRDVTREQLANQERKHVYLQMEEAARKRKMAEEILDEVRAELARAERQAILGRLAEVLFQEINRSARMVGDGLGVLRNRCLQEPAPSPSECAETMEELAAAAIRTGHILDKLALLRPEGDETGGAFDLRLLVEEAVRDSALAAEQAGIRLEHRLSELPPVEGSRHLMAAVLSSLLLNAIEAARESQGSVFVSVRRERQFARIDVRDTGKGIEAANLPHIFNPFFTTRAQSQSIGLGLTICQAIVQGHHGHIEVESEPSAGTTVKVLLPLPR